MGTFTGTDIITRVRYILNDENASAYRWTSAELLAWINDAQAVICLLKPDAYIVPASSQLAAGVRQSLPSGAVRLVDVPRNMGLDGNTPGPAITLIDKGELDRYYPDWPEQTASAEVISYMYDDAFPEYFYVYPPQPSSGMGYVEMLLAKRPTALSAVGSTIGLGDEFLPAILQYVAASALAKDTDNNLAGQNRAMVHLQSFLNLLGMHEQAEALISPRGTVVVRPTQTEA